MEILGRPSRRAFTLGAFATIAGRSQASLPSGFPDRPIRVVVPFPPGGTGDTFVRTVGLQMARTLGQQVLVDNRPGASTLIGTQQVVFAPPDGYTLLATSVSLTTLQVVNRKLAFDVTRDLVPVTMPVFLHGVLAASLDAPFQDFRGMLDFAKHTPGRLTIGVSPGQTGSARFTLELLKQVADIDFIIVPYAGGSAVVNALLAKDIHCLIDALPASAPHIKAGKMRGLAVWAPVRTLGLPDIPSIAELGMPELAHEGWFGLLAPRGTPEPVLALLNREILSAARLPPVREKFIGLGMEPADVSPREFGQRIAATVATWDQVARKANLQFD